MSRFLTINPFVALVIILGGIALVISYGVPPSREMERPSTPKVWVPFTISQRHMTYQGSDTVLQSKEIITYGRRSDGSSFYKREFALPGRNSAVILAIADMNSRRFVVADSRTESKMTSKLRAETIRAYESTTLCHGLATPTTVLEGYRVVEEDHMFQGEGLRVVSWRSPDFDCAELARKTYRLSGRGNALTLVSETDLLLLKKGPPRQASSRSQTIPNAPSQMSERC